MKLRVFCVVVVMLVLALLSACGSSGSESSSALSSEVSSSIDIERKMTYAELLAKYKEIEDNNYANLGGDEFAWATTDGYNFTFDSRFSDTKLVYSYCDINNDGVLELIMGGKTVFDSGNTGIEIAIIYTLVDGLALPIVGTYGYPEGIGVIECSDKTLVIEVARGRQDHAREAFYTIGSGGKLVTLDILCTNGFYRYDEEEGIAYYNRTKDIEGTEKSITEEEYQNLLRKYGSCGYFPLDKSIEQREVKLDWKLLSE